MSSTRESKLTRLSKECLTDDQQDLIDAIYNYNSKLIVATMGAGKTVSALTAISELQDAREVGDVLILAPKEPCLEVWAKDFKKWAHLKDLEIGVAVGDAQHRKEVLDKRLPITVINFENVRWLIEDYDVSLNRFDGLLIDEMTKLSVVSGSTYKLTYRLSKNMTWRVGLTGTPVHETLTKLYDMLKILDRGKTLGTNKEKFLTRYFFPEDWDRRKWVPKSPQHAKDLLKAVEASIHVMPDYTKDLIQPRVINAGFNLTEVVRSRYKEMVKSMAIEFEEDNVVFAKNSGVVSQKLVQLTAGFIYMGGTENRVKWLCEERYFIAIQQITALIRKHGSVLVFAWLRPSIRKLYTMLKAFGFRVMHNKEPEAYDAWNNGAMEVLLMQPRSAGHGLNLMDGGHVTYWFQPVWSNDLTDQANGRVYRRGQEHGCLFSTLYAENTIDELMMQRVNDKKEWDKMLREHFLSF